MTTTDLPTLTPELVAYFTHVAECRDPSQLRVEVNPRSGRVGLYCCRFTPLPRLGRSALTCNATRERAAEPTPTATPRLSRYALECIDCEHVIQLDRPQPRVPLCPACRWHREQQAEADRRRRIAAARHRQARGAGS